MFISIINNVARNELTESEICYVKLAEILQNDLSQ